ncbi:hypothetical protein HY415_00755 [Candidatus Kaiserbacteria bacterium]|nr:hypothetical protein [Candidatus Kaiserbacteria bacterium]
MKGLPLLFLGIVTVVVLGIGGLVYRNALERPLQRVACPLDALVCPDGTSVGRTGSSCAFPACPPPNVSFPDVGITFAIPAGFVPAEVPDAASVAAYEMDSSTADITSSIVIRRYVIGAPSTALATIQETAIGGASGKPVSATSFSSTALGNYRFTVVSIERFEGVVSTAYYLARPTDVLRFDAIDRGVADWANPGLNSSTLPAHAALLRLLTTLQGQ